MNILFLLYQQGRSYVDIEDPSFAAVSFYMAITILHEFCHFLVRYKSGKRNSPLKLRRKHRGERVDVGSSMEIALFQGIMRLVRHKKENQDYFSLLLDFTSPACRLWVDMKVICEVCQSFIPAFCFWEDVDADSASFKLQDEDSILNYNPLLDDIPLEKFEPESEFDNSDEAALREMGLDPERHEISLWKWDCLIPLKSLSE